MAAANSKVGHGVSPPYPLFGLLPTRKLASNPQSPHPGPLPREREQVAAAPKVRCISRIAQRIKSSLHPTHAPNPKKAACTFKKLSAGCFLMCFHCPSSFPRKKGKSECYRQPAPRAATRKLGYGGATPCRLSGCGDGRCRLLLRLHACRSNHATASMCAVCGNRLSMPAARNA